MCSENSGPNANSDCIFGIGTAVPTSSTRKVSSPLALAVNSTNCTGINWQHAQIMAEEEKVVTV